MRIRRIAAGDSEWIRRMLTERWGGPVIFTCQSSHDASALPGFIAERRDVPAGLVTFRMEARECEVVTLDAVERWSGIGTALLRAVESEAAHAGCERVWLVTSNDNIDALRFYQRRGYAISSVNRGAIEETRRLRKPSIPRTGCYGIAIRDEIVLDKALCRGGVTEGGAKP